MTYLKNDMEKLQRYIVDEETGCWTWQGSTTKRGYGQCRFTGKVMYVHRLVAEIFIQPLELDDVVHHKCMNQLCINPEHLQVVDKREHTSYHSKLYHGTL